MGVGKVRTSGSIGGVMVSTLVRNPRDASLVSCSGRIISPC